METSEKCLLDKSIVVEIYTYLHISREVFDSWWATVLFRRLVYAKIGLKVKAQVGTRDRVDSVIKTKK